MKVTITKILTPIANIFGEQKRCNELTQRKEAKVLFLDPWANDYKQRQFFREFTIEIGHVLDENSTALEVVPDVSYTINGVTHFHQDGVAFGKEIDNYHLADKATYEVLVRRYATGAKIDLFRHYKGSGLSKAKDRINDSKRYRSVQYSKSYPYIMGTITFTIITKKGEKPQCLKLVIGLQRPSS